MNVDELRRTLHEPPDVPLTVSLERVVSRGRRRRLVRRAALPAAAVVAVLAVGVPALVAGGGAGLPAAARRTPQAEPTSAPWLIPPAEPSSAAGCPLLSGPALEQLPPCGTVIRTGERTAGGERVFWFSALDRPGSLSVQEGRRAAAGTVGPVGNIPLAGRPISPVAVLAGGPAAPAGLYGVVAIPGPVTRVVLRSGSRSVPARVATWSVDPDVSVFWVVDGPLGRLAAAGGVLDLRATAYGAGGRVYESGSLVAGQG